MNRRRQPNTYAFIDSQNLNLGVQKYGWKMDWRKFRKYLADEYGVTNAYMFIGYVPEFEPLYDQMHDSGYMVVLKPTFDITRAQDEPTGEGTHEAKTEQPEEKKPIKGNIDADLVLWAMKEINNYDKAIIVSDDGDFFSLVEYLLGRGKLAKLLTPTQHYSNLYHPYQEHIEQIWRLRRKLAYHDRKKR
ncbi:MAG TPA: NYN domain-containing protein [Candidatus Saccharimonadales bacterium]|nr:NYN domain-containing protein [Candidatus Saccharimonadales bacterium]